MEHVSASLDEHIQRPCGYMSLVYHQCTVAYRHPGTICIYTTTEEESAVGDQILRGSGFDPHPVAIPTTASKSVKTVLCVHILASTLRQNLYDGEKEYWVKLRERGSKKEQVSHEEKQRTVKARQIGVCMCEYTMHPPQIHMHHICTSIYIYTYPYRGYKCI